MRAPPCVFTGMAKPSCQWVYTGTGRKVLSGHLSARGAQWGLKLHFFTWIPSKYSNSYIFRTDLSPLRKRSPVRVEAAFFHLDTIKIFKLLHIPNRLVTSPQEEPSEGWGCKVAGSLRWGWDTSPCEQPGVIVTSNCPFSLLGVFFGFILTGLIFFFSIWFGWNKSPDNITMLMIMLITSHLGPKKPPHKRREGGVSIVYHDCRYHLCQIFQPACKTYWPAGGRRN